MGQKKQPPKKNSAFEGKAAAPKKGAKAVSPKEASNVEAFELNVKGTFDEIAKPKDDSHIKIEALKSFELKGEAQVRVKVTGPSFATKKWILATFGVKGMSTTEQQKEVYTGKVPLLDFMACACECAKETGGYVTQKKSEANKQAGGTLETTSYSAFKMLQDKTGAFRKSTTWKASLGKAKAIIKWVRDLTDDDETNEYVQSLRLAFAKDELSDKLTGIAASAISAYGRNNRGEDDKLSSWVGEPGDLLEPFEAEIMFTKSGEGSRGPWFLVKFRDLEKNIFVWFAKKDPQVETGDIVMISDAQINADANKSHTEYEGVKQTSISWCKMVKKGGA